MPRLTEQEQQEILRFLEADKPLPDKYRFLLFEDKREVELVWNGKTNEVCNIVLPFQVIEQVDEPRAEGAPRPGGSRVAEAPEQYGFDFDQRGRQLKGWTNKLIWSGQNFREAIESDPTVKERLSAQDVEHAFDIEYHLKHLAHTFEVLGI